MANNFSIDPTMRSLKLQSGKKVAAVTEVIDLTGDEYQHNTTPKTVEIDPRGDLKLIVGDEKVCFLVSSRALYQSSPVWKTTLYQSKSADGRDWEIQLPEDDPAAFEIILNLVHWPGQFNNIRKVDLNLAFEVTVLTNKYSMTHCLAPCARAWMADLVPAPEQEEVDQYGEPSVSWAPPLQWLWVARELGDLKEYVKAFRLLALHCGYLAQLGPNRALNTWNAETSQYKPVLEHDNNLSAAARLVVTDLIDQVNFARVQALGEITSCVRKGVTLLRHTVETNRKFYDTYHVGQVTPRTICQADNASFEDRLQCDLHMLGTAISAQGNMHGSLTCAPEDQLVSAKHFRETLLQHLIQCDHQGTRFRGRAHRGCTPFTRDPPSLAALDRLVDGIAKANAYRLLCQAERSDL